MTAYPGARFRSRSNVLPLLGLGAGLVGFVALLGASIAVPYLTHETITTTVSRNGERICSTTQEGSDCKYLEFTEAEVFENTDSFAFFKFNSSDIHSAMQAGRTCELGVTGFRVPFMSMYRNIVSADCR